MRGEKKGRPSRSGPVRLFCLGSRGRFRVLRFRFSENDTTVDRESI